MDSAAAARTQVWVISLATASQRRASFQESAASSGLAWSFWDAHQQLDAALSYDRDGLLINLGRPLTDAERGCYSSHYSLWQWLIQSPCEQMIVLEDDVIADWRFLEALSRIRFEDYGIEYLRLFAKVPSQWRYVRSPFLGWYHHLIRFTGYPLGTQAYLMCRSAALKMLSAGSSVTAPVDAFMDQSWLHGVLNLALHPFHIVERYQSSSIGEERLRDGATPGGRTRLPRARRYVKRKLRLAWSVYGPEPLAARRLKRELVRRDVRVPALVGAADGGAPQIHKT